MAELLINDASGRVQFSSTRKVLVMIGKGFPEGSPPAGTIGVALGAGGTTYAFGYPTTESNYGLKLYNAAGQLLFDAVAEGKVARPVAVMSGNIVPPKLTETKQIVLPSGRTYAAWIHSRVSTLRVRSGTIDVGGNLNHVYYLDDQEMTVSISGDTVSITATRIEDMSPKGATIAGPYEDAAKYDWRALVLDVTGY